MQQRVRYDLRLKIRLHITTKHICVHLVPSCHSETPLVLKLPTEVEVHVRYNQAVSVPGKRRRTRGVRSWEMAGTVEMSEICVLRLSISRGKRVGENLSPNTVNWRDKVTIRYRSVTCLQNHELHKLNQFCGQFLMNKYNFYIVFGL